MLILIGLESEIKDNKEIINLSGGYSDEDNPNKLTASYTQNAEVYLNGKSDQDLISLLSDYKISVSWNKKGEGRQTRVYYLKDFLVNRY